MNQRFADAALQPHDPDYAFITRRFSDLLRQKRDLNNIQFVQISHRLFDVSMNKYTHAFVLVQTIQRSFFEHKMYKLGLYLRRSWSNTVLVAYCTYFLSSAVSSEQRKDVVPGPGSISLYEYGKLQR